MVAIAKPATTKQTAKQREAARRRYIKSATILIEGQRARITSQYDAGKRYDVRIEAGKATSCTCADRQYRRTYCKHMEATDRRLALPQLPAGVAKYRKVRGKAELVAVPTKVKEIKEIKEVQEPTTRRTAKLTAPVVIPPTKHEISIVERHEVEACGVALRVTDSATPGRSFDVTLRRTKEHGCACLDAELGLRCVHIAYCVETENARWHAERASAVEAAKIAAQARKTEPVAAQPVKAETAEEKRRYGAPLNGNKGFNLMRR